MEPRSPRPDDAHRGGALGVSLTGFMVGASDDRAGHRKVFAARGAKAVEDLPIQQPQNLS
jgi:hypothetical protein